MGLVRGQALGSLGVGLLFTIASLAARLASAKRASPIKTLFSDIDGTIVHYYANGEATPPAWTSLALPASKTGRRGFISLETLRLMAKIRSEGTRVVLVSGMRFSTFVDRLPFLPYADAYVIDNGGRIFYPMVAASDSGEGDSSSAEKDSAMPTGPRPSQLREDMEWRNRLAEACGPAEEDALPSEERHGPLWDACRSLQTSGWEVDTDQYFTMIRVTGRGKGGDSGAGSKADDAMDPELSSLLAGLDSRLVSSSNLGLVIIFPRTSGKKNAAEYVAEKCFGASLEHCIAMGDDDNDIEMALSMGKGAYLTGFTSESVRAAVAEAPERFTVASSSGVEAADEVLLKVLSACRGGASAVAAGSSLAKPAAIAAAVAFAVAAAVAVRAEKG